MEAIYVALITAIGGIVIALVQKGRNENKEDHGKVMEKLIDLHTDVHNVDIKVDKVEHKLDSHLVLDHPTSKVKSKKK
jgi:hypothetical protein